MTKQLNRLQKDLMAKYAKEHPLIGKVLLPKCGPARTEALNLWEELSTKLNAIGPPIKNADLWRKGFGDHRYYQAKKKRKLYKEWCLEQAEKKKLLSSHQVRVPNDNTSDEFSIIKVEEKSVEDWMGMETDHYDSAEGNMFDETSSFSNQQSGNFFVGTTTATETYNRHQISSTELSSNNHDTELFRLLTRWEVPHLYNLLCDEKINIRILKLMKPKHVERLLNNLALGDQVLFEYHFDLWRQKHITVLPTVHNSDVLSSSNCEVQLETNNYEVRHDTSHEADTLSFRKVLEETHKGKMITKYYEQNQKLNEEQRNILISIIASYMAKNGLNLSTVNCFPTVKLMFSNEFNTKDKKERLYDELKSKLNDLANEKPAPEEFITSDADTDNFNVDMLRSDLITSDEFFYYWKRCGRLRRMEISASNSIQEILAIWPEYKQPCCDRLIDIDYAVKYYSSTSLMSIWPERKCNLLKLLGRNISCSNSIFEWIKNLPLFNAESQDLILLWALHGLFPPTEKGYSAKLIKDSSGANNVKRYSIEDSQDSFVIIGKTVSDLDKKLEALKLQKNFIQPCLLVIGDLSNVTEIYFYLDGERYYMPNTLRAADLLFKFYFVFDFKYPSECFKFYNFVQTYFYDISPAQNCSITDDFIKGLDTFID